LGKAPESVTAKKPVVETAIPAVKPAVSRPAYTQVPKAEPLISAPVAEKKPEKPFVPAIPVQQTLEMPEQVTIEPVKEAPWRIAGEVLHTYIICEDEAGCVWLVDKHAAHERVNFDRLKAALEPPMRQTLLQPIAAELEQEDAVLLLENTALLESFGFACEDFGDNTVLVREVPADMNAEDTVSTLEEFAEKLRNGRSPAERREAMLHTMACKAAIKGGWTSDPAELRVLVDRVQSGEVRFCPHGRPIAVKLTKYELEKMFKRA
jgi:DNA mismatch repair protein MutL